MEHLSVYKEILTIIVPVATTALGIQAWLYTRLESVRKEAQECRDGLAAFREKVARENVTQTTLEKFEDRLVKAVDKLGDRLDRLVPITTTTVVK